MSYENMVNVLQSELKMKTRIVKEYCSSTIINQEKSQPSRNCSCNQHLSDPKVLIIVYSSDPDLQNIIRLDFFSCASI